MAEALAEFAGRRGEIEAVLDRMANTTVEVSTGDGRIAVTMTLDGAVSAIRFTDDAHREHSADDLAATLLELLDQGRRAAAAGAQTLAGLPTAGPGADGSVPGERLAAALADLESLFSSKPGGPVG